MKSFDADKKVNELTAFLKSTIESSGLSNAVVAVSGGVDSATSLGLLTRAIGPRNVYALLLPYGELNTQGVLDAQEACTVFSIPKDQVQVINIQPLVAPVISLDAAIESVRKGNVMARMRMIILFDVAKKRKALVVGTENKTEHLLGYYTRFGDEASDIEPLRQLYKTQVYQVATYLGVPQSIITKAPTAGLWEGQTDESDFGFSYKEADDVLSLVVDQGKTVEEICGLGYESLQIQKIVSRMKANQFKRQLPYLPLP